jgi:hypothetical protein
MVNPVASQAAPVASQAAPAAAAPPLTPQQEASRELLLAAMEDAQRKSVPTHLLFDLVPLVGPAPSCRVTPRVGL